MTGSWTEGVGRSVTQIMAPAADVDVTKLGLWPAVRDARPETAMLADGFSCRTQIQAGHLGREGIHLAQLLAELTGNRSN